MVKYRVTIKQMDADRAFRFGWGDPHALDFIVHPGAQSQKYNEKHRPKGPKGGQFAPKDGSDVPADQSEVYFEVAPDPNNEDLTNRWNALSDEEKQHISEAIAESMSKEVLKELGIKGMLEKQIGGYLGATNPSLALEVDPEHALAAAHLLGYALSQDSMMVVSAKPVPGFDEVGAVVVNFGKGDMNMSALTKHYNNLYKITDKKGNPLVGGFTASNGRMVILNYSGTSNDKLAALVDKQLGGKYSVHTDKVYSAFPQRKDYGNASSSQAGRGAAAVWRQSADRLRSKAADEIEAELVRRKRHAGQGGRRGSKASRVVVRRAKKRQQ